MNTSFKAIFAIAVMSATSEAVMLNKQDSQMNLAQTEFIFSIIPAIYEAGVAVGVIPEDNPVSESREVVVDALADGAVAAGNGIIQGVASIDSEFEPVRAGVNEFDNNNAECMESTFDDCAW